MNERDFQQLQEAAWRRKLTPAEEAALQPFLAAHPAARDKLETDAALTHLLGQLPDAPLASNFTAQVLQAVARAAAQTGRGPAAWTVVRTWLTQRGARLGWATALAALALFAWKQHDLTQRSRVVEGMAPVLQAAALPDPQLLQDFEAIALLSPLPPVSDVELLNALSQ
jgi:anti-sigma factor RsiW